MAGRVFRRSGSRRAIRLTLGLISMTSLVAASSCGATATKSAPIPVAGEAETSRTQTDESQPTSDPEAGASTTTVASATPEPEPVSAAADAEPLTVDGTDLEPVGSFGGVVRRVIVGPAGLAAVVVDSSDDPASLVTLSRDGDILAERPVRPGDPNRRPTITVTGDTLAFLDGGADRWEFLDPIDLSLLGSVELAAGPQTVSEGTDDSLLAVAHWRSDNDLDRGVRTLQAATITEVNRLDEAGVDGALVETTATRWALPSCGGRDIAVVDATAYVTVRCSWLLARLADDGTIAAFHPMHRGEAWIEAHDGFLYLTYRNLGIVSRFDPATGDIISAQVELTPGQLLRDARFAAGSVWVIAENTTGTGPTTLLRFGEDLSEVTVLDMEGWRATIGYDDDVVWLAPETGGLVPVPFEALTERPRPTVLIDPPAEVVTQEGRTADIVEIERRFAPLFDPATPAAELAGVLERAEELEPARQELAAFVAGGLFGAELVVSTFVPRDDEAVATFTFTLDGAPLLAPQVMRLVPGPDGWVVPAASFCDAIAVLFIDCPIPV